MRTVKSAEELDHLRYAAWLTDRSAAALVEAAVPGATELDLVDAVESSYGGTGAHQPHPLRRDHVDGRAGPLRARPVADRRARSKPGRRWCSS